MIEVTRVENARPCFRIRRAGLLAATATGRRFLSDKLREGISFHTVVVAELLVCLLVRVMVDVEFCGSLCLRLDRLRLEPKRCVDRGFHFGAWQNAGCCSSVLVSGGPPSPGRSAFAQQIHELMRYVFLVGSCCDV